MNKFKYIFFVKISLNTFQTRDGKTGRPPRTGWVKFDMWVESTDPRRALRRVNGLTRHQLKNF